MSRDPLAGLRWLSWLTAISLVVLLMALAEYIYRLEADRLQELQSNLVLQEAATMRARIEGELNSNLYITSGLVGYVSAYDLLETERVTTALGVLHRNARHIRNVALAPGNVISHVYPVAGNEAAVGLNYRQTAEQWPDVERAMLERKTILTGPVSLVQGGRGLISRTPVFLGEEEYWGMLSLVLDSDSLFRAVGMSSQRGDFRFALRWAGDGPRSGEVFIGDADVFPSATAVLPIPVPGGVWEMGAINHQALGPRALHLVIYRGFGYALALVIAVLAFLVLEERRRIARMALVDHLTGLPNRRWCVLHLRKAFRRLQQQKGRAALVYVDLDGFKAVNDRLGHRVGDEVLEQLAARMQRTVRKGDFLARIGGDEFVILVEGVSTRADATARVQPLIDAIREPIMGYAESIALDASIGVALYPEDGVDHPELMAAADGIMYASKLDRRAARASDSQSQPQLQ